MSLESWASNAWGSLFGGGTGTPIVAGSVPTDAPYGQVLAAMNPGMTGYAGLSNEAFNPTQPFASQEPNWSGSNDKLSGALKDLAKGVGGAKAIADTAPMAAGGAAGGKTGGGGGHGLDQLVALLAKRREQWMQSALSGEVPKQSSTSGLLGL